MREAEWTVTMLLRWEDVNIAESREEALCPPHVIL